MEKCGRNKKIVIQNSNDSLTDISQLKCRTVLCEICDIRRKITEKCICIKNLENDVFINIKIILDPQTNIFKRSKIISL